MQPNAIPNYSRNADPSIPRAVLEARRKIIDQRREEIEQRLMRGLPAYEAQELRSEYSDLGNARNDIDNALRPRPAPKVDEEQRQRDIAFLRNEIKNQTEITNANAEREEAAGNFRAARQHRSTLLTLPEDICRHYGKSVQLLGEF